MNITEIISYELLLPIILLCIIALFITQFITIISLKKKLHKIPQVQASTLFEAKLHKFRKELTQLQDKHTSLSSELTAVFPKLTTIKRSSLVRYNPFRDSGVGGLQSFSIAFIDRNGDGVVLSNLYSREMTRVTAKEIKSWKSVDQELSPEEKQALEKTQ